MRVLIFLIALCSFEAQSQTINKEMEISYVAKNIASLDNFIRKYTDRLNPVFLKDSVDNNFLMFNKFNRQLNQSKLKFYLFNLLVQNIYAFEEEKNLALYIFVRIDSTTIKSVIQALGKPENIYDEKEIEDGSFSFLTWKINCMSIWVIKNRFLKSNSAKGVNSTIVITNMEIADLIKNYL